METYLLNPDHRDQDAIPPFNLHQEVVRWPAPYLALEFGKAQPPKSSVARVRQASPDILWVGARPTSW